MYDGISLVFLTAFIGIPCIPCLCRPVPLPHGKTVRRQLAFIALAAFIGNAHVYRFLKIKYINGTPETGIIFEEWNPINRVTVIA